MGSTGLLRDGRLQGEAHVFVEDDVRLVRIADEDVELSRGERPMGIVGSEIRLCVVESSSISDEAVYSDGERPERAESRRQTGRHGGGWEEARFCPNGKCGDVRAKQIDYKLGFTAVCSYARMCNYGGDPVKQPTR